MDWIRSSLDDLAARDLLRDPPTCGTASDGPSDGRTISVDGTRYVSFGSNNYLALAGDARLAAAAGEAARAFGAGAGASRLIVGTLSIHRELEEALAAFKGTEDAVLFSTGYQAGVAAVSALAGASDAVVMDKLSHACLIDGARASGARVRTYPHLKTVRMTELLERESKARRRLVVTDSLFSMDGDVAPLNTIVSEAKRLDAMVVVDEAHATGTMGPGGRGLVAENGVGCERVVQMGTLSKALGGVGGFLAGSRVLCEYLRNVARSYIYTTAPAPAAVGAAIAALRIVAEEGRHLSALRARAGEFRTSMGIAGEATPIVPVEVGTERRALECQAALKEEGYWVPAIRPPTVPRGRSRLRVSITAAHTAEDVAALARALARLGLRAESESDS